VDNNNTAMAQQLQQQQQQQRLQQTRQGTPLVLLPNITGNVLATVSFLIGKSSFILGLNPKCIKDYIAIIIYNYNSTVSITIIPN
jgi:hypothetical protein